MNAPNRLHNNPPDPLDEALAPYGDHITEAEAWLDGQEVTNEGQMKAVDALLKQIKAAEKDLTAAQKSEAAPLHDAWKAALARYKPTLDDLGRIKVGLIALVDGFKRKLAEEKRAAERAAWEAAEKARREAETKAAQAAATDIDAQRQAEEARIAAIEAEKAAQAAKRDNVKGLRTVTRYEITDHRALLHWIATNRREDLTAFIEEWARRNHKDHANAEGLRVWQEKEAF
jgi:hypothetical protein